MSEDDLLRATRVGDGQEVLRLIDEEQVDMNSQPVGYVRFSFPSFFPRWIFVQTVWKNTFYRSFLQWKLGFDAALAC